MTATYSARNTDVRDLPIGQVIASSLNPRTHFDDAALAELTESIRSDGVMQPIVVRPVTLARQVELLGDLAEPGTEVWEIVMGERRWRASKLAGRETIPAVIRDDLDDADHLRLALVENLIRQDLDPIEEAEGYRRLNLEVGLKQKAIAQAVNRSQPAVANAMRLLDLPVDVQERIRRRELSISHGLAIAKWKGFPELQSWLAGAAVEREWTSKIVESWKAEVHQLPNDIARPVGRHGGAVFDTSVCLECPFGAYRKGSYSDTCLNPAHWQELQDAAVAARNERQAAEIAAAEVVTGKALPLLKDHQGWRQVDSYQHPEACTDACPCRVTAIGHGGDPVQCCTDWQRYGQLREDGRKAKAQAKLDRFTRRSAELRATIDGLDSVTAFELAPIIAAALRVADAPTVAEAARHLGDLLPAKSAGKYLRSSAQVEFAALLSQASLDQLIKFGLEATLSGDLAATASEWSDGDERRAGWYLSEVAPVGRDDVIDTPRTTWSTDAAVLANMKHQPEEVEAAE